MLIPSDEGLTLVTSALESPYGGQDKNSFPLPHRRSTTVSLGTNLLVLDSVYYFVACQFFKLFFQAWISSL